MKRLPLWRQPLCAADCTSPPPLMPKPSPSPAARSSSATALRPIEGGTVVIRDGNIVAAGEGVAVPAGARMIDATGKWVTPGIFAGFSRLGLSEVDAVNGTNDKSGGNSGFSAAIDIAPAIDPFRSPIAVNRSAGVTRAVVAPEAASSIFAGQGAIADLGATVNQSPKPRRSSSSNLAKRARRMRAAAVRATICISVRCCVRRRLMPPVTMRLTMIC